MLERKYEAVNSKAIAENEREIQQASAGGSMPEVKHVAFSNSALARYLSALFYQADRNEDATRIEMDQLREAFRSQPTIYKQPLPEAVNTIETRLTEGVRLDILSFIGLSPIKEEKVFTQYFPFFQEKSLQSPLFKLPVLVERPNKITRVEIVIGEQRQTLELLEDMGAVIEDTFNARYTGTFLKTYIRTLLKYTALDLLDKETQKKSSGKFGGLLQAGGMMAAKAAFDATENADVRMSRYLPDKAYVGSLILQPGTYDVIINYYCDEYLFQSEIKEGYEISEGSVNLMQLINLGIDKSAFESMAKGDLITGSGESNRGKSGSKKPWITLPMTTNIFIGGGNNWVSGDHKELFDSVLGFNIGISVESNKEDPVFSEMGLRYITRGWQFSVNTLGYKYKSTLSNNYIDAFMKYKYEVFDDKKHSIQPYIGMASGFCLSSEESVSFQGITETKKNKVSLDDMTTCLLLGTDLVVSQSFVIGLEYNRGLLGDAPHTRTNAFIVNLGYKFKGGSR